MDDANKRKRITQLYRLIGKWDELAKDNPDNVHNLSTLQRQDWINELLRLIIEL